MNLNTISPLFTTEILRKVIQNIYEKKTGKTKAPKILNHTVNYASSKGDGYIGVIYRVNVNLQDGQSVNIIVKGMPANINRRKLFNCVPFFEKEILFYAKIVPTLKEFEKNQSQKESYLSVPDCYYAISDGESDFIVLEDLVDDGYETLDRTKDIGVTQTETIFKTMARFHGVSLAMNQINPQKYQNLSKYISDPLYASGLREWIEDYLIAQAQNFTRAIEDELKDTEYLSKFKKFVTPETYYDTMMTYVDNKECATVCHGDPWIGNFMFKNNSSSVKIIDFQLLRYGCLMLDLSCIIFACTSAQDRDKVGGVEGIFKIYQHELQQVVTSLGAPNAALTLEQIKQLWRKFGAHGLGSSIEMLVLALVENEDVPDLNELPEGLKIADLASGAEIKSEEGKKRLAEVVKLAVDEGLI